MVDFRILSTTPLPGFGDFGEISPDANSRISATTHKTLAKPAAGPAPQVFSTHLEILGRTTDNVAANVSVAPLLWG